MSHMSKDQDREPWRISSCQERYNRPRCVILPLSSTSRRDSWILHTSPIPIRSEANNAPTEDTFCPSIKFHTAASCLQGSSLVLEFLTWTTSSCAVGPFAPLVMNLEVSNQRFEESVAELSTAVSTSLGSSNYNPFENVILSISFLTGYTKS